MDETATDLDVVEPRERGRPSSYRPEYAEQASKLCALGATNTDLADFFGCSTRTIERWASQFEDFCRSLKQGREAADNRVERSLYQQAVGYQYDAVKIFQHNGDPLIVPYRETVQPSAAACIFWLKNRRKDVWRERVDVDHTHTLKLADEFEKLVRGLNAPRVIEHISDSEPKDAS